MNLIKRKTVRRNRNRRRGNGLARVAQVLRVPKAVIACLLSAVPAMAAVRTPNFIVSAPTPALEQKLATAAEAYRKDLAIEWTGTEFPNWNQPCPIYATLASGAGGVTSFTFAEVNGRTEVYGWQMNIQGSEQRLLDSVLPHEISHTILATHFRRPVPRWADEGACTTVEHADEQARHYRMLWEFLQTKRGIPFGQMFGMKEYPPDVLPLYSQGYSLSKFLIAHGGRRHFVGYLGDGMASNDWPAATSEIYGYATLRELQDTWLDWVIAGSPGTPKVRTVGYGGECGWVWQPGLGWVQRCPPQQQPQRMAPVKPRQQAPKPKPAGPIDKAQGRSGQGCCNGDCCKCGDTIKSLQAEVADLKQLAERAKSLIDDPSKLAGPKGDKGDRGEQGPAGESAQRPLIDYTKLAGEVAKRQPPTPAFFNIVPRNKKR